MFITELDEWILRYMKNKRYLTVSAYKMYFTYVLLFLLEFFHLDINEIVFVKNVS